MDRRQKKLEAKRRKAKEKKRKARQLAASGSRPSDLAYHGNKYLDERHLPVLMAIESAVVEASAASDGQLTDRDVTAEVVDTIQRIRRGGLLQIVGGLPKAAEVEEPEATAAPAAPAELESEEHKADAAAADPRSLLKLFLGMHLRNHPSVAHVGRDGVVGALRTVLGSVAEPYVAGAQCARGYVKFIEKTLGEMGLGAWKLAAEDLDQVELVYDDDDFYDDEDAEYDGTDEEAGRDLEELMLDWIEGDDDEAYELRRAAEALIRSGQAQEVLDLCQTLLVRAGGSPRADALSVLALDAQRALQFQPPR